MRAKNLKTMAIDVEMMAEARLWRAVLASTIQEWVSGPMRLKREAEKYLFGNDKDFPRVCESAGMDAGRLRAGLLKVCRDGHMGC
jgi:hypothetical protein